MTFSRLVLVLLLSVPVPALAAPRDVAAHTRQIEAVVEQFRTAILHKDKERFLKLFLHDSPIWQSVHADESLARVRQKVPDATKVRVAPKDNHLDFIDWIVSGKEQREEKFSHVRIDTDGDIASVTFDYSFHVDGRMTNSGREAWHLVNTGGGWKIVSVIWSVTPPKESRSQ
ncbi:nuclear transport factor 2 family protein [Corallococcus exercitus]|uniref:Nuclear transport factor 2 family protein n=1 Tax=Corallococcus exercitus TaxID=2316736 RepID=A0A7Y4NF77_9BACT|nr:nuclear transport factor 2 family protein [Corallococcus exercitus]NOK12278.1 nuclear transport factor 2 family protein [Corallococcus exercitus]